MKGENKIQAPGAKNTYSTDPALGAADTATLKWDVSRQMQTTLLNPNSIPTPDLEAAGYKPIAFPGDDYEGNDDPILSGEVPDEDANPYVARLQSVQVGAPVDDLAHQIGELSAIDTPATPVLNSWGRDQIEFGVKTIFREFARVEIFDGAKVREEQHYWYRISNFELWHHILSAKFKSSSGEWENAGSHSGLGAAP